MGLAFYVTDEQHEQAIKLVYTAISAMHQEIQEFRHWCDDLLRDQKELSASKIAALTRRIEDLERNSNQNPPS